MISKRKVATGLALVLSAVALTTLTSQLKAFAESESGGFVWGGDSESGGAMRTGAATESGGEPQNIGESESGGFYGGGSSTESGGERANGSSSETGGFNEIGAESESGGPWGKATVPPVYVKTYNWKATTGQ